MASFNDIDDIDMFVADQVAETDAGTIRRSTARPTKKGPVKSNLTRTKKLHAQVVLSFYRRRLLRNLRRSYGQEVDEQQKLARCFLPKRQIMTGSVSSISPKYVRLALPAPHQTTQSLPRDKMSEAEYYRRYNHSRRNKHYLVKRSCYMPATCTSCFRA